MTVDTDDACVINFWFILETNKREAPSLFEMYVPASIGQILDQINPFFQNIAQFC